ncbi:MAG: hypothetical protein GXP38_01410 [Chloroflexi bacterium]|nr:hypothetical protein [Chloroflexota bacterium]
MSSCQLDTARAELAKGITLRFDTDTIEIERVAVHPYPDLQRLWVRVQLSTFATPPTIRLSCRDAEGNEVAETSNGRISTSLSPCTFAIPKQKQLIPSMSKLLVMNNSWPARNTPSPWSLKK